MTAKKKNKKKKPPPSCWVVASAHHPERLFRYFEFDVVEYYEFTSFECRVYTVPKPQWQDDGGGGASEEQDRTTTATKPPAIYGK